MEFLTDFCGGNARILGVDGDRVHFANEIRDTMGDWFYWAFAVKGAAGRTITFDCSPPDSIASANRGAFPFASFARIGTERRSPA